MATSNLLARERNVAAVVRKANETLGKILGDSGTILYSSCETLKCGKYYFLGLNPGGSEEGTETIQKSLDNLRVFKGNAYLKGDEQADWSSPKCRYAQGEHPYQQAFKFLFEALEEKPRDVCASNLIFKRSPDARGARYPELAKLCWPVHETILEIVQPDAIIAFGTQAFEFVAKQLDGDPAEILYSKPGYWSWQRSITAGGKKLIGFRHPSRYSLTKNPNVVNEVTEFLGPIVCRRG